MTTGNNDNTHKDNTKKNTIFYKTTQSALLLCLFLCWLVIGLYLLLAPSKEYSAAERRKLAQAPTLTAASIQNGTYLSAVESYAKDQFPQRELFRNLKTASSIYGFGRSQDKGYTIINGHLAMMDMELNPSSVSYACTQMQHLYDTYLADSGCNVYYCVIPDKNYYLNQSDPSYPVLDYEAMRAQLADSINFAAPIDITNDLELSSFYCTDTHWRQECILPAAETILAEMSVLSQTGNTENVSDEEHTISASDEKHTGSAPSLSEQYITVTALDSFYGVLAGNMGWHIISEPLLYLTNDTIEHTYVTYIDNNNCHTVYDDYYLTYEGPGADPYFFFLSGSTALAVMETEDASPDSQELIIFRDSYGSSIAPLFLASYDRVTLIDTRYINPSMLGDYVDFHGQDVLFLYSTVIMNNSYSLQPPR